MSNYKDLIAKRQELESQIAEARKAEISDALSQINDLINAFELTKEDVFPTQTKTTKAHGSTGAKVAPKYKDPATGKTWTGRGKAPKWIEGQDRAGFMIVVEAAL